MKRIRLTARIILYTVLAAAIVAAWVAVTAINLPSPEVPSGGLDSFAASVDSLSEVILAARDSGVDELTGVGMEGTIGRAGERRVTGYDYNGRVTDLTRTLLMEVGRTGPPTTVDDFPESPVLDESLDEADRLYAERNRERTSAAEIILRESMLAESADYIRWIGSRVLSATLQRDIIKYRTLEALPFQEIKSTIYGNEGGTLRERLDGMRSAALTDVEDVTGAIDGVYDNEVGGLIDRVIDNWEETGTSGGDGESMHEAVENILRRIDGFYGGRIPSMVVELPENPGLTSMVEWAEQERGETEEIRGRHSSGREEQ